LLRAAGLPWACVAAGLLSFPALWTLYLGQFGLLCGALLIYGFSRLEARPLRAGAALGVLAIKPQYALLVPVVVFSARRWRALAAGAAMLALMLAISWVLGGTSCWRAYFGPGREALQALLVQKFPAQYEAMGSSVFWMLRSLDVSVAASYFGQGLVSLFCALAAWRLWRADAKNRLAATIVLSLLASPYGFTGDMAMVCAVLPTLARRNAPWRNAALAWLWVAPAFVPLFVLHAGILPTPLLLLAVLCLSLAEQKQPLLAEQIGQPA
jgi:hypothetical protein